MGIYRKSDGIIKPITGMIIQRWDNRIFPTTHSVVDDKDVYTIIRTDGKIDRFDDFTEYCIHFSEPNETNQVYVKLGTIEKQLKRTDGEAIAIGFLVNRFNIYTIDDENIYLDSFLQLPADNYRGYFTYAINSMTNIGEILPESQWYHSQPTYQLNLPIVPKEGDTCIVLETHEIMKCVHGVKSDGTFTLNWTPIGEVDNLKAGDYWVIHYYRESETSYTRTCNIVWDVNIENADGTKGNWDIVEGEFNIRPDEDTIRYNLNNRMYVHKLLYPLEAGDGIRISAAYPSYIPDADRISKNGFWYGDSDATFRIAVDNEAGNVKFAFQEYEKIPGTSTYKPGYMYANVALEDIPITNNDIKTHLGDNAAAAFDTLSNVATRASDLVNVRTIETYTNEGFELDNVRVNIDPEQFAVTERPILIFVNGVAVTYTVSGVNVIFDTALTNNDNYITMLYEDLTVMNNIVEV